MQERRLLLPAAAPVPDSLVSPQAYDQAQSTSPWLWDCTQTMLALSKHT